MDLAARYRLIADHMEDCVFLYDLDSMRMVFISPSVRKLVGLGPEEAAERRLQDWLAPDAPAQPVRRLRQRIARFRSGDRSDAVLSGRDTFRLLTADGQPKDLAVATLLSEAPETGCLQIIGTARDSTQTAALEARLQDEHRKRRLAEKTVKEQKAHLRQIRREFGAQKAVLQNIVITDDLTGIFNRYYLDTHIADAMERSDRYGEPLSLIIFDLDHFKRVNDQWGHDVGDRVLMAVADKARRGVRRSDLLARWGGEEFAVLAPETALAGASRLAEKLRLDIAGMTIGDGVRVTASFGAGERFKGESYENWFRRVDQALFRAKQRGRNRVETSADHESETIAQVRLFWKSAWACGIQSVDEQHRRLIDLSNRLIGAALAENQADSLLMDLDVLIDHALKHFDHEEQMLALIGYPGAARHAGIHRDLAAKAEALRRQYLEGGAKPSAIFTYLVDEVVIGHLMAEDTQFFAYTRHHAQQDEMMERRAGAPID